MSESEFEKAIRALTARAELLRQVRAGQVKLRRVKVKSYICPEHRVRAHDRWIAPVRQKVVTARKLGMAA